MTDILPGSIAGLTFEPEGHVYRLGGTVVASVTQVIDGQLRDFSGIPNIILERARELGTLVHIATALDARNALDESSVDDEVWPYLRAWRRFMTERKPKIISSEEMVYHPLYGYCGTLDHRILLDGSHTLIDKKTGIADDADKVQTSAYLEAWNYDKQSPFRIRRRGALYLNASGAYKLDFHTDKADFQTFLSASTIYKRRARNG